MIEPRWLQRGRGLRRGADLPVALAIAVALMALGLSGPVGSAIALTAAVATVAVVVAIRHPRGPAWPWILVGSLAWALEEAVWSAVRLQAIEALPSILNGALSLTDVFYLSGTLAWLIALLRMPHVRRPTWTLAAVPPLLVLGMVLFDLLDAGMALSFPFLDTLVLLASLPALEGTLRGRASDGRLLLTLGFFVRAFTSANFAWLSDSMLVPDLVSHHALWLLAYLLIGLGVWLELRDDERTLWPATLVVVGLEAVVLVTASSVFGAGLGARGTTITIATIGYVQLLGVLAVLIGDRRRRLKAEDDLRQWSRLLHQLASTSASATRIERPLEGLWQEARSLLPTLHGLSAYGEPPLLLGRDDGYAYPLVRDGAEIGHLHFSRQPDGSEMLDALTPLFTQQIERMHEHASWRDQAMTDALTGLHNRRGFELQLGRLLGREHGPGGTLLVAILDLDHFKRVNDLHGHPVGDEVLVLLARMLREHLREQDVVVRWGGEEFLVVATGLNERVGTALLGRLASALRAATPEPLTSPLTFSAGMVVGDIPTDAADIFERIERADDALYAAKRAGRDRVLVAPTEGPLLTETRA